MRIDDFTQERIKSEIYGIVMDNASKEALKAYKNLDFDVDIDFVDKHFVFSGFKHNEPVDEIKKRGGIVHGSMVKKADYLVIDMYSPGVIKLDKALELRKQGYPVCIISSHQLYEAFKHTEPIDA